MSVSELTDIAGVRRRPGMYVGSSGFCGFIHYLVGGVNLNLAGAPSWLTISNARGRITIESDADLALEQAKDGAVIPFERFGRKKRAVGLGIDGVVLNALSESLSVEATSRERRWSLECRSGCRKSLGIRKAAGKETSSRISFAPDRTILANDPISPYNFHSYVKRLSYLNPDVRFSTTIGGRRRVYHSVKGIRDMFEAVFAPFQILHEPIHFRVVEDDLDLELVVAFQSWYNDFCWTFVNNGRAVQGGTHEKGLAAGLKAFRSKMNFAEKSSKIDNGIVGIMSLHSPRIVWEGCLKARIGDPELTKIVRRLVVTNCLKWVDEHVDVAAQLREIDTFQFLDVWPS